jgi:hypothetical protein
MTKAISPTSEYVLELLWREDWGEEYKNFYHSFYQYCYPSNIQYKNIRSALDPHMRAQGFESDNNCANCNPPGYIEDIKGCEACIAKWRPIERQNEKREDHIEEAPASSEKAEEDEEKNQDPNPLQLTVGTRMRQESDRKMKKKGKKGKRASMWASSRM